MFTNDKNTASSLLDNGFSSDSAFASFLIPSASYAFDDKVFDPRAHVTAPGMLGSAVGLARAIGTGVVTFTTRSGTAAILANQTAAHPMVDALHVGCSGSERHPARRRPFRTCRELCSCASSRHPDRHRITHQRHTFLIR